MKRFLFLFLVLFIAKTVGTAMAEIPCASHECGTGKRETTPSDAFTLVGDEGDVVRHEDTSLEWRRCTLGQKWDGVTCLGSPEHFTWEEALRVERKSDSWRLPEINELRSIVEECRRNPGINRMVFPNTPAARFWSATRYHGSGDRAWTVYFYDGDGGWRYMQENRTIRLVRDADAERN